MRGGQGSVRPQLLMHRARCAAVGKLVQARWHGLVRGSNLGFLGPNEGYGQPGVPHLQGGGQHSTRVPLTPQVLK
jgi:hypothetical protein